MILLRTDFLGYGVYGETRGSSRSHYFLIIVITLSIIIIFPFHFLPFFISGHEFWTKGIPLFPNFHYIKMIHALVCAIMTLSEVAKTSSSDSLPDVSQFVSIKIEKVIVIHLPIALSVDV